MRNDKYSLMRALQEADFALYETVLYLDGHPTNKKALEYYGKIRDEAKALRESYEKSYGPLTVYGNNDANDWHHIDRPWPWEKGAY